MHIGSKSTATKFILNLLQNFKFPLFVMVISALMWAVDLSLRPYMFKILLDRMARTLPIAAFQALAFPALFYFFLMLIYSSSTHVYSYYVEVKMMPQLRKKIIESGFSFLLKQGYLFHQRNLPGTLVSKINDLVSAIPSLVHLVIDRFFSHILGLIGATYALWQVDVSFAIAMLIWTFFMLLGSLFWFKSLEKLSKMYSESIGILLGDLVDAFANIISIKLFANEKYERKILHKTVEQSVIQETNVQKFYFWLWILYRYSFVIVQGINLYFLLLGRQRNLISIGDFALVLSINGAVVGAVGSLTEDLSLFSKLSGIILQALSTLTEPLEMIDSENAPDLIVSHATVAFENVEFSPAPLTTILYQTSITVKAGEKVGLVGYSGSGKTTFVNLILRLIDPTKGKIFIDGQDIKMVKQKSLRRAIAMIPQHASLFHRSLLENIRYGKLNATLEEVKAASEQAHIHDFISHLKNQYDTFANGEIKFSGGQRQLIIIARTILKDSPLLILDEATSHLDSLTENKIQDSFWGAMGSKTSFVISHRLSTLVRMDRILVFDKGKIIQDGTHQELVLAPGLYRNLWNSQMNGFLPENPSNII